jgi:putative PIN family toxin of toxin-antitoxin system
MDDDHHPRLTFVNGIAYDTVMSERIVMDTNVAVAGLRSSRGASFRLLQLIGAGDFEIALSVPLVLEYEDILKRESAVLGLASKDVDTLVEYWCSVAHLQEIHFLWRPVLRDPKDDHILELAVAAGCGLIVTHNTRDFSESTTWGVEAIRPGEFLRRMGVASWAR